MVPLRQNSLSFEPPAVRNLAASLLCLAVGLEMSSSLLLGVERVG